MRTDPLLRLAQVTAERASGGHVRRVVDEVSLEVPYVLPPAVVVLLVGLPVAAALLAAAVAAARRRPSPRLLAEAGRA